MAIRFRAPAAALALAMAAAVATFPAFAPAQAVQPGGLTRTLDPLPVTIRYENRYGRVADKVGEICRDELPRLARELGLTTLHPFEIVITSDARGYDATLTEGLPTWGTAFAILEEQRILVDVDRATRAYNSLDEVIPHELSHLLLYQKVPRVRFPIWFLEGLAQWQAREWSLVDSWQLMNTVWSGGAPRLRDISWGYPAGEEQARAAYRMSYAAFTALFSESAFRQLPEFLDEVGRARSFDFAFREYWGFAVEDYDAYFRDDIERRYHTKLLAFQSGPLFGFAAVLFLVVILRHIVRSRRRFRQLEE